MCLPVIVMLLLSGTPSEVTVEGEKPSQQRLQDAVQRGVSFIAEKGPEFQKKKSCTTCHHGPLTVRPQREPARLGLSVNKAALDEFNEFIDKRVIPKAKKGPDKNRWHHTLSAFLTLSQPADWKANDEPEAAQALGYGIVSAQQEDGSWKAAGQFSGQRRPKKEADVLQTMWNIHALSRLEDHDPALSVPRKKALKWVRAVPKPVATDTRALRLLTEFRFGDASHTKEMLSKLLEDQNDDGSWSWTAGEAGDAWATGIMLYVLSFLGEDVPAARIESAQSFLLTSQTENGSWFVQTKMNPQKHESEVSTFFGTSWSVIGLAHTFGRQ